MPKYVLVIDVPHIEDVDPLNLLFLSCALVDGHDDVGYSDVTSPSHAGYLILYVDVRVSNIWIVAACL